jgi:hypothetical protein
MVGAMIFDSSEVQETNSRAELEKTILMLRANKVRKARLAQPNGFVFWELEFDDSAFIVTDVAPQAAEERKPHNPFFEQPE